MSSKDDTSDASTSYSPQFSPLQQVPQISIGNNGMKFKETSLHQDQGTRPFLRIIVQPQDQFRFRYRSETAGTHGCLSGRKDGTSRKTHPTVALVNYHKRARIRCRLVQNDNDRDHPHQLEDEGRDVSAEVGPNYTVKFAGLGIIHTAKKDVPQVLFQKYSQDLAQHVDGKSLRTHCDELAKSIDLNIVRLKFSAHEIDTDEEICSPVFSEPIHNMKSALTNELKICRISKAYGSARGGENLFLLVEKVSKKDIEVHFVEDCPKTGMELWRGKGRFIQSDVHHQYAIVCKTPAYHKQDLDREVPVYIELVRPSNGRTSERVNFTYKAEHVFKHKKRKYDLYSSLASSLNNSMKITEPSTTVANLQTPSPSPPSNQISTDDMIETREHQVVLSPLPVLSQPNVPSPINTPVQSNSNDSVGLNDIFESDEQQIDMQDEEAFLNSGVVDYFFKHYNINDDSSYMHEYNLEDIMFTNLQSDGIKEKVKEKMADPQKMSITDKEDKSNDNSGLYSEEDEPELKKLLKEIGVLLMEAKKSKNFYESKTKNVRMKLQQLMDMRLDNGDTFLHMTLCNNTLPSMEFIVKLIHSLQMTPTLNLVNNKSQTILHLAIMNNMPDYVPFLISNGCDPMIKDHQGNNAIHYAVIYKSCLSPLLCSIKSNRVNCDLDCYNDDKQTALHIAAQYGPAESVSLLLEHGAGHGARDIDGRTPLHLAAYDDSVANTEALLAYVPANEIDVVDGNTNTALQIVCGLQHQHSIDIARLLLDKGANPLKCDDKKKTAWALAERNLELMTLLKRYISSEHNTVEDIKPESEDEYESTVEDITETGMEDLPKYINEVSAILDRSDAWRELAKRLHQDTLLSCYEKLSSPTSVLLAQLKESQENFSSESLAMILNDMGEKEAANIIYTCLD